MHRKLFRLLLWAFFFFYNLVLVRSSLLPYDEMPPSIRDVNGFLMHSVGYFFLFILTHIVFEFPSPGKIKSRAFILSACWCLGMGVLLEWAQTFVPGRSAQLEDVLANLTGIALAAGLLKYLKKQAVKT
ncbi:MAG: VanZ family protein [Candidatus Omnitrophica bacterium]|nr:VanZ family protein [Candidatus Omnitrophota bacterium]